MVIEGVQGIATTNSFRRAWRLAGRAVGFCEPVLLVGETGCGKTSLCQAIAAGRGRPCRIVNCHQSTETSDIIGGLRPVRGREGLLSDAVDALGRSIAILGLHRPDCIQSQLSDLFRQIHATTHEAGGTDVQPYANWSEDVLEEVLRYLRNGIEAGRSEGSEDDLNNFAEVMKDADNLTNVRRYIEIAEECLRRYR